MMTVPELMRRLREIQATLPLDEQRAASEAVMIEYVNDCWYTKIMTMSDEDIQRMGFGDEAQP